MAELDELRKAGRGAEAEDLEDVRDVSSQMPRLAH